MKLTCREWLINELCVSKKTPLDFFTETYTRIFQKPCNSNRIEIDVRHWNEAGVVPQYVWSYWDRLNDLLADEPRKTKRFAAGWIRDDWKTVTEPFRLLTAYRNKEGKWVC
jgi:hypothetical protein